MNTSDNTCSVAEHEGADPDDDREDEDAETSGDSDEDDDERPATVFDEQTQQEIPNVPVYKVYDADEPEPSDQDDEDPCIPGQDGCLEDGTDENLPFDETRPYNSSSCDFRDENRDPNYVNSLDLDDINVDLDLEKVDFESEWKKNPPEPEEFVIQSEPGGLVEDTRAIPIEIVSREEWGAEPRPSLEVVLEKPVPFIHMEYHTDTEPCYTKEDCILKVKEIQKRHITERGLSDIGYNFLLGGDGRAYEGRGWHVQPEPTNELPVYNGKYLEFVFIGDYREDVQTPALCRTQFSLLKIGLDQGIIDQKFNFIMKYIDLTSNLYEFKKKFNKKKKINK